MPSFARLCRAALLLVLCIPPYPSGVRAQETTLADCTKPAQEIFADISPAIVQIVSFGVDPHRVAGRVRSGMGSGVLFGDNLVLTNYHVVHSGKMILVNNGSWSRAAEPIGSDPALDIALLVLPEPVDAAPDIPYGSHDDLAVGQTAYVIGYPLGIGQTMTSGIISGLDRKIPLNTISWTTRYIQTDAPISPGNSGGALVDACGRFIGLVTLGSGHPSAENIGYALPVDTVDRIIRELLENGHVARAWHGLYGQVMTPLIARIMPQDPKPPSQGFLIETVEPGSASDRAGLRGGYFPVLWGNSSLLLGGDIILAVEDETVTSLDQALNIVEALEIGSTVRVKVWRDGDIREVDAHLEERPEHPGDLWPDANR